MSLEDLRRLGVLVEEEAWSGENHRTKVRASAFLPVVAVWLASCAAIGLGDGGWLTWIGVITFLAALFTFIVVNIRGIDPRE